MPTIPPRLVFAATLLAAASRAVLAQSDPASATLAPVTVSGTADPADATTEGSDAYTVRSTGAATGIRLSPRQTPQSVGAITRAQLEDFNLLSINDALENATGINVEKVETDRTYFTARGFAITNFQFDGIGLPFTNGLLDGDLDTALYDRIEVLRGANGLLSSTGNPSATVNFVRRRPAADFQAAAGLTLGSWNNRRLDADISSPLNAAGTVRGRLTAAVQERDSYLDRYSMEKQVLGATIEADLTSRTRLTAGLTYQKNQPRGVMWGALPLYYTDGSATDYPVSTSTSANGTSWNTQDTQLFAELAHDFGDGWTGRAVVNRRDLRSDGRLFYAYGTPDRATGLGLYSYPSLYRSTEKQTLADLSAEGGFSLGGRRHELSLGASAARSRVAQTSWYGDDIGTALPSLSSWMGDYPLPAFDAYTLGAGYAIERQSLRAAARWNLADRWKLITGANLTRIRSRGESYGVAHAYDATKATPFVGAVHDLDARHSVYASYAGIFNPQVELDANLQPLAPARGRTVEAGVKGEWMDKRLNGSAAVFRARQENVAESAGYVGALLVYQGLKATSDGFELDLAGRIAQGWEASAGYTQLRIVDDEGRQARTYVPRRTFRLSTSYRVPQLPGLKVGANLKWQSRIYRDQGAVDTSGNEIYTTQKAYALLGLMARYDFDRHWSATLNINNLTDRKYINSLYWAQGYYGAPRNATIALKWQY